MDKIDEIELTDMAKKKNLYFTKVHEDAIVQYARTDDNKQEQIIYSIYRTTFSEMVDKIIYVRFISLPNIEVKDECKIWLTTILDKYDPTKDLKPFHILSHHQELVYSQGKKNKPEQSKRSSNR